MGAVIRAGAALAAVALTFCGFGAPAASAALRVRGSHLVDGRGAGHVVQIRGINRSGTEYACIQGWGFFDSPHPERIDDPAMIAAMRTWDINAVRVPLNEDCWLGVNTPAGRGGAPYRQIVEEYVRALHAAGLYVVLDLFGELGETDCRHGYIDQLLRFADAHRIGYLGWTWDAVSPGGWSCTGGPSLIADYQGTPTGFGVGFRDHLIGLGVPERP